MGHYGCTVCNYFKHHYNLCHQLASFVTTLYILFYNIFTYMDHGVFILFGKLILLTLTWNSQLVKIYETYFWKDQGQSCRWKKVIFFNYMRRRNCKFVPPKNISVLKAHPSSLQHALICASIMIFRFLADFYVVAYRGDFIVYGVFISAVVTCFLKQNLYFYPITDFKPVLETRLRGTNCTFYRT